MKKEHFVILTGKDDFELMKPFMESLSYAVYLIDMSNVCIDPKPSKENLISRLSAISADAQEGLILYVAGDVTKHLLDVLLEQPQLTGYIKKIIVYQTPLKAEMVRKRMGKILLDFTDEELKKIFPNYPLLENLGKVQGAISWLFVFPLRILYLDKVSFIFPPEKVEIAEAKNISQEIEIIFLPRGYGMFSPSFGEIFIDHLYDNWIRLGEVDPKFKDYPEELN